MGQPYIVPEEVAKAIRNRIPDHEAWLERYNGVQGKEGALAIYADSLGRCHFYLANTETAESLFNEAFENRRIHLDRFRKKFSEIMYEKAGTWREPKPTELVSELMECARPGWWIEDPRATPLLEEALELSESGLQHELSGVQFESHLNAYYACVALGKNEAATEWIRSARQWLEDHKDFPFEDPRNLISVLQICAQALDEASEPVIQEAWRQLTRYMESDDYILLYGINPSDEIYVYELMRRRFGHALHYEAK